MPDNDPLVGLEAALRAAGDQRPVETVAALVRAIAAAPEGPDPEAWLDLVAPAGPAALRAELKLLKGRLASATPLEPPLAERVARLRGELRGRQLDGLLLPLTDEHQSEYLPGAAERLKWVTGFTGSAAFLVLLQERAAVFVDGRYTVQAEAELDPALFERCHVTDSPPSSWIEAHLGAGQRLGYDPDLHTSSEIERYRKAAVKAGADLIAIEDGNPVDAVWAARPPQPVAPVQVLDDRYAGESPTSKCSRMGDAVRQAGADLAVLSAPDSIAWLLNIRGGDIPFNPLVLAFALLHGDGGVELFIDPRKLKPGQNFGNAVAVQPIDRFHEALAQLSDRSVLVDPGTSVGIRNRLERAGAKVVSGDEPCRLAKAKKNPVELEGAREAQRRDGAAVCRFLAWLETEVTRRPITERAAAERLAIERAKDPLCRGPSFETISAAGPNAALPHYRVTEASDTTLTPGTLYLTDSGGQYLDATTDITRTVAIGPPTPEMCQHFTLVLRGHIALARAVFPTGTSGAQLDPFARQHLWAAGLDFDHGTGHGIGAYLCVHEGPARISKRGGDVALEPGMILSNEPGYYRPGAYGIRIENLVAVRSLPRPDGGERDLLGFETLTRAPLDRRLIVRAMLDPSETAWLDTYHTKVRADLIDLLDEPTRSWLVAATRPLDT